MATKQPIKETKPASAKKSLDSIKSEAIKEKLKDFYKSHGLIIALLIKMSGLGAVDASGKIGGNVIGHGKGGMFARVQIKPINRRSSFQMNVRALFGYFSQLWRTLTDGQRSGWNSLADEATYTNIFGDSKTLTGKALFNKINLNLNKADKAEILNAPAFTGATSALGYNPLADVSALEMFVGAIFPGLATEVPAGNQLCVYATASLSQGITAPKKNRFRLIRALGDGDDTATENIWADYTARFAAPVAGANVWLMIESVNSTTGFSSVAFSAPVVVSA